jgi:signal transduction histidine kinase
VLPFPELRIVLCYLVVASLWISYSDMALEWLTDNRLDSVQLQTYKGVNFVATTAVLLYVVLRRSYNRWRRAEQQLRALLVRLESLREEERTRIAQEVHDELGQTLTALKMDLRWAEKHLGQEPSPTLNPVLDRIVEASELADATLDSVKRIAGELRPGVLEDLGLAAALRQEAQRFQERAGVGCRLQLPDSLPAMPTEVATAVFRIFQEALTNVGRHAESTEVEVELVQEGEEVVLRVADNGKGIRASVLDDAKSLGLLGMRERAESLGGQLTVQPGSPRGTVVKLTLPVPRQEGAVSQA